MYVIHASETTIETDSKQFFVRLSELFEARRKKEHGSVFLTQKRSKQALNTRQTTRR